MKFIAIIGFAMALEAFWYQGDNQINSTIFVVLVTAILYSILFVVNRLKESKNKWIDLFFYFVTRCKKEYYFEKIEITYDYINVNEIEYRKNYNLVAVKKFNKFKDRYRWTGNSENHKIITKDEYDVEGPTIQLGYKYFTIDLKKTVQKRSPAHIPIIIRNLKDPEYISRPFLGVAITEKTQEVEILVKVPKDLISPSSPKLYVFSREYAEEDIIGEPEPLNYNEEKHGFFIPISYPRRGRKYAIEWSWKENPVDINDKNEQYIGIKG
ncbi:MAG: hypothetical protein FWC79_07040 [Oscillospiraceae bacterium]|nr:hypothetical protein [Oscillospiraceae bacterium]